MLFACVSHVLYSGLWFHSGGTPSRSGQDSGCEICSHADVNEGRSDFTHYKVALGRNPVGPKLRKGDHKTPEGEYAIDGRKEHSRFYRALHISYPNAEDRERAQAGGYDPGGDVEIHGIENGLGWIGSLHRRVDWTDGCVAVTDSEMDEIWNVVKVGTKVEVLR